MAITEYFELDVNRFPIRMVSIDPYESHKTKLKSGDTFIAVGKVKLGSDDYSLLDTNGCPHHYSGCHLSMLD